MSTSGSNDASGITGTLHRKKIIYVDDVTYSLVMLKNRLREYYEIYTAESVQKMYELLLNIKPDLILLDINMPGIDGYEALKSLKADSRYSNIPVIFLTGNSDNEDEFKSLCLGAVDYVVKPFNVSKLIGSIEKQFKHDEEEINNIPETENNNKPIILVVDDVLSILRVIQHALSDRYKVYTLSKSIDVIDFLGNKKPDLIILDYVMPGLNGLDLITIIRELPQYKDTPIIIMTTEGTYDLENEAMSLGASDFIAKPFSPQELHNKIAKHIILPDENRV